MYSHIKVTAMFVKPRNVFFTSHLYSVGSRLFEIDIIFFLFGFTGDP